MRRDMEALKKGPSSVACASHWRQPSPLAMTQMRWPTETSEHGQRRGVSPFSSVGGMPCPSNKDAGRRDRKNPAFLLSTKARRQTTKDCRIVFGFQTTLEMERRISNFFWFRSLPGTSLWYNNLCMCACASRVVHLFG